MNVCMWLRNIVQDMIDNEQVTLGFLIVPQN